MDFYDIPDFTKELYPILFIPKHCTLLEINCETSKPVCLNLNITSPDEEGNEVCIYSGQCMVKLVDAANINIVTDNPTVEVGSPEETASLASFDSHDIDQMPVIFADRSPVPFPSYNQSQVWIDPSRSPYVYNHYDTTTNNTYSINESGGCITVQQHNTYITQNVINYDLAAQEKLDNDSVLKKGKRTLDQNQKIQPIYEEPDYYDDDSDSDLFLSQIAREKQNRATQRHNLLSLPDKHDGEALKQLMSTESSSKQRKTILYLGNDSTSGQTIQKISYSDPMIKCSEIEVDHEVTIEDLSSLNPKKKKYQCDKCKQIFQRISSFRQHMTGKHLAVSTREKKGGYRCKECGKNLKTYQKYQKHLLGHGDPDVECPKCHKVYSSSGTLKVHLKIHSRKFPCSYCPRTYATAHTYKTHMRKSHSKFLCKFENCSFMANSETVLSDHHDDHIYEEEQNDQKMIYEQDNNNNSKQIDHEIDYQELDQEFNDHIEIERVINKSSESDLAEAFPDDFSDGEFGNESVLLDEAVKSEIESSNSSDVKSNDEGDRIKEADLVIAKVMSNKLFLLNAKNAKKHAKISKNNKSCQVCSKSFDRVSDLKRHLIEHIIKSTLAKTVSSAQGFLDILCEICQAESFDSIDKYKAHLREHAKLTIYKCTFCDKSFSDSSNFSKHKKIHGVSYYQCDLCHRKFNSKVMITRHMEYHNKNKPLKCKLCNRYFHFESMLNKHVRTAHRVVVSKYPCKFCDQVLRSLKEKWDHEWAVHSIRKLIVDCQLCEARFRKYCELKRHCIDTHGIEIKSLNFLKKKNVRNY